jgi:hypothetical protein
LKSSPEAVRGSRKAEGGKSAGTVDESVTDSVNPFSGFLTRKCANPPFRICGNLFETALPFNN